MGKTGSPAESSHDQIGTAQTSKIDSLLPAVASVGTWILQAVPKAVGSPFQRARPSAR